MIVQRPFSARPIRYVTYKKASSDAPCSMRLTSSASNLAYIMTARRRFTPVRDLLGMARTSSYLTPRKQRGDGLEDIVFSVVESPGSVTRHEPGLIKYVWISCVLHTTFDCAFRADGGPGSKSSGFGAEPWI
jgi:hypothetical protein